MRTAYWDTKQLLSGEESSRDCMVVFWLDYRPALRFIRRNLAPMGGVVKAGSKLLVHPWAVHRLLNRTGRCPQCRRHWDDKLALQELHENERKAEEIPQFSIGGLRDGLRWREKFNELVPEGGEKVTFEDIKPRMSIFGDPRTWEPEEEEKPEPRKWKLGRVS